MRTMSELSKDLGAGIYDIYKNHGAEACFRELRVRIASRKEEILYSWWAENGFSPGKAVLVEDFSNPVECKVYIREATQTELEHCRRTSQEERLLLEVADLSEKLSAAISALNRRSNHE